MPEVARIGRHQGNFDRYDGDKWVNSMLVTDSIGCDSGEVLQCLDFIYLPVCDYTVLRLFITINCETLL